MREDIWLNVTHLSRYSMNSSTRAHESKPHMQKQITLEEKKKVCSLSRFAFLVSRDDTAAANYETDILIFGHMMLLCNMRIVNRCRIKSHTHFLFHFTFLHDPPLNTTTPYRSTAVNMSWSRLNLISRIWDTASCESNLMFHETWQLIQSPCFCQVFIYSAFNITNQWNSYKMTSDDFESLTCK